jgi:hypothetical protein
MAITNNVRDIRNKTEEDLRNDYLRKMPFAIRKYFADSFTHKFDVLYNNKESENFLQKHRSVPYPISDREFGSPNERIANIFSNHFNYGEVDDIIERYIDTKSWVYHPVRPFEDWRHIARRYYNDETLFWVPIIFNRIVDPFQALKDFNVVRIPSSNFYLELPTRIYFDYTGSTDYRI